MSNFCIPFVFSPSGFFLGWLRVFDQPNSTSCPGADVDWTVLPPDLCGLLYSILLRNYPLNADLFCRFPGKKSKRLRKGDGVKLFLLLN